MTAPVATDPFAVRGQLREETLTRTNDPARAPTPFPPAPAGLPKAPAVCAAFVSRKKTAPPACTDAASAFASLDTALSETDSAKSDAQLTALEGCPLLPVGFVRALRIERAPMACGDALALPLVNAPPREMSGAMHHALTGLALAARLSRTGSGVPTLAAPHDKARVTAFIKGPVFAWMNDQAKAIQELSAAGATLSDYGKAVVAVEAGLADLRIVELVRALPVPDTFAKDPELLAVYEGSLDQMLDPRKDRGRDAALVGLHELAILGVVKDDRVTRARRLLSQLYAGRRIDALDALLLPPRETVPTPDVNARLAARLPTFYAGLVLPPPPPLATKTLRAMAEVGVPRAFRVALKSEKLDSEARTTYARARIALGQQYWRAVDFDEATALLTRGPKDEARSAEGDLYLALALALHGGPDDASQMIKRPAPDALGTADTVALDAIALSNPRGPYAGMAAFDAALIRRAFAPRAPNPALWRDLAARFRAAADMLSVPEQHARALEGAREADAIAAEVGK